MMHGPPCPGCSTWGGIPSGVPMWEHIEDAMRVCIVELERHDQPFIDAGRDRLELLLRPCRTCQGSGSVAVGFAMFPCPDCRPA